MKSSEFITDAVNPKVFKRGFEKTKLILNGKYMLVAKHGALPYIPGKKASESDQFRIEAYDNNVMIAWVNFENINDNLEALDLVVQPSYRRQGIATEMYTFAKELDNTVVPSSKQTPDGKAFWKGMK